MAVAVVMAVAHTEEVRGRYIWAGPRNDSTPRDQAQAKEIEGDLAS